MPSDLTERIEAWFMDHRDDGEFMYPTRDVAYAVIGPATSATKMIVTTKPAAISAAIRAYAVPERFGMIGRYGLPNPGDVRWFGERAGPRDVLFLGDMDPADLMIFAWLRACLHPKPIAYVGVGDAFLQMLHISFAAVLPMPCAPSELEAIRILEQVFPDLCQTVGAESARTLKEGNKIEIEAVVSAKETPAALLRSADLVEN